MSSTALKNTGTRLPSTQSFKLGSLRCCERLNALLGDDLVETGLVESLGGVQKLTVLTMRVRVLTRRWRYQAIEAGNEAV